MKDARISQFNAAGALSGSEYVPIAQLSNATNTIRTVYTNPDAFKQFVLDSVADVFCPVGSIGTYASSVTAADVPGGWLLCNGQSVSRSTYSNLFNRIGTIYGTSSDTTFNVPNLKGRVVMGYCSSESIISLSGVTSEEFSTSPIVSLGSIGGKFGHQLHSSELPIQRRLVSTGATNAVEVSVFKRNFDTYTAGTGGLIYGGLTVSLNNQINGGLKSLFSNILPPYITFSYKGFQTCGFVTNNGVWQSLGCSGNSNSIKGTVTVAPDSNGDVQFRVADMGWGYQTLEVSVLVPGGSTLDVQEDNSSTAAFNITQPYMVLNYIIKY